jgi:predicted SnoaL-like aldol condensation-catalyzing enzyme
MSAVRTLYRQSVRGLLSFGARYWLLASNPSVYFDKFIKNKRATDLRQSVKYLLLAVTCVTLFLTAVLSFEQFANLISPTIHATLTKQYPFLIVMLLATLPALALICLVFRSIRNSISNAVFIYVDVLSFWIFFILGIITVWVVFALMLLPFQLVASSVLVRIFSPNSSYWYILMFFFGVFFYTCATAFYYVPLRLLERGTGRSTLFASTLCISCLMICVLSWTAVVRATGQSSSTPPAIAEVADPEVELDADDANKTAVLEFYEQGLNVKDFNAAAKYFGQNYIQHNPTARDGIEGFKEFVSFLRDKFPNSRNEIKRAFVDGDYVVLHVHSMREPGTRGRAVVDIFRLENGKIVEHWDVAQDIPEKMPHNNGMF